LAINPRAVPIPPANGPKANKPAPGLQETILARHCGLRVAAVSVITNLAEGMTDEPLSHEQTLRAAEAGAGDLARLLIDFIPRLSDADR